MIELQKTHASPVPTILIILGITGDLSRRKLLPALLDLMAADMLPERFRVVGFSRREFAPEDFRDFVREAIKEKKHDHNDALVDRFLAALSYCQGFFDDLSTYRRLEGHLKTIEDTEFGHGANKLYYLAVPPDLYETILGNLTASGITASSEGVAEWARILVEKPFGNDTDTAEKLDALLGRLFKEEQIFRIDHYLAKEALQNVIFFRFSNMLFEPVWNRRYVEKVEVKLFEQSGVEGRGAFYDSVGALRDVGQNHLLQMLALVAMEHPGVADAHHIRKERAMALSALGSVSLGNVREVAFRGQYEGYENEKGVLPDSQTETYFRLKAFINNERWRGIPFYLESGKALNESKTEIVVTFKPPERCLCPTEGVCEHRNALTFRIQPNEGITVRFWIKKPGLAPALQEKTLSFSYAQSPESERLPDAHERLFYDAIMGDQTLFASTDEVRAAWKFITPILEAWGDTPLYRYEKGSRGPEAENA